MKVSGENTSSIYTDPEAFATTAHSAAQCTGCHTDFAYKTPHMNTDSEVEAWRDIAKLACKGCHEGSFSEVTKGAHSPATTPGEDPKVTAASRVQQGKPESVPLCGDCHGSHDIQYLDVERWETSGTAEVAEAAKQGQADIHGTGLEMCGGCHVAEAETYADYYHGAAYRQGAPDAPACWDCHGHHEMLPASDRRSPVNEAHLVETCGRCHDDVNEKYIEYAQLVHRREDVEGEIPIYTFFESTRTAIEGAIQTVASWFQGEA
ncbi:MAG TPA: hypothetical protein VLA05_11680 [Coriobacteriia bacterium]|nr:hypothetical protein [Coriobacteriia bacterium]